jgi:hypothetical protein
LLFLQWREQYQQSVALAKRQDYQTHRRLTRAGGNCNFCQAKLSSPGNSFWPHPESTATGPICEECNKKDRPRCWALNSPQALWGMMSHLALIPRQDGYVPSYIEAAVDALVVVCWRWLNRNKMMHGAVTGLPSLITVGAPYAWTMVLDHKGNRVRCIDNWA